MPFFKVKTMGRDSAHRSGGASVRAVLASGGQPGRAKGWSGFESGEHRDIVEGTAA